MFIFTIPKTIAGAAYEIVYVLFLTIIIVIFKISIATTPPTAALAPLLNIERRLYTEFTTYVIALDKHYRLPCF